MIECEVLAGLKPAAVGEVRRVLGRRAELVADDDPTALRFGYAGPLEALLRLRTAVARMCAEECRSSWSASESFSVSMASAASDFVNPSIGLAALTMTL